MTKKLFFSILILAFISIQQSSLHAQSNFNGWVASFGTFKLSEKISIHGDAQLRSTDDWEQTQALLLRTGINYHINKKFVVSAGYAFVHNKRMINSVAGFADEHRIWEQLIYNHKIKTVVVQHRLRFEQRFIPKVAVVNNELDTYDHAFGTRVRYFIRNIIPIKKQATFTNGVFAAVQNEVFVNATNKSAVNNKFFDQNRFYLAVGYRVSPKFDIETGYINQYISGTANTFTNNHIIQLATYIRL